MGKGKIFICILAVVMAFAATSCGQNGRDDSLNDSSSSHDNSFDSGSGDSSQPDDREEMNLDTLCRQLSADYYRKNLKTSQQSGLSDPSVVGADEEKMKETRYPVPPESEFAAVYNVADRGILPSNADNSALLNALLKSLKGTEGLKKIYFPAGVYRFSSTLVLNGLSGVYFTGEKTTEFMMTEWTEAVKLSECEDIHFNDIDFDYATSSTVTGTVVAADDTARSVTVLINEGFDLTNYRYNGGKIKYGNYMEFVRDERTGDWIPDKDGMLRYNSTGDQVQMIPDGSYDEATNRLTLTFGTGYYKRPEIGKTVSVGYTMYEFYTVYASDCSDFYMESCNVYSSVGMTFGLYSSKNIYLNRTNLVLREGSNKLMTATADGLHTNDCYGEIVVSNSIYEYSHDDAINVCTFYKTVSSVSGNVITCNAPDAASNFPTEAGDIIEIYNRAMEVVQTYTVTSVSGYGLVYEITVNKRVKEVEEGYLVGNLTRTPALTVDNCVFRNKRNRGILCQTQNSSIRNCTFYNVIHGSVSLHSSFDGYFNEGLIPRDVTVENCKFINNCAEGSTADIFVSRFGGEIKPGTITGITIENNFFNGDFEYGLSFVGAGDCTAKNNLFYNDRSASVKKYYLANVTKSENISLTDNFVYFSAAKGVWKFIEESDSTGIVLSGNGVHNAEAANK